MHEVRSYSKPKWIQKLKKERFCLADARQRSSYRRKTKNKTSFGADMQDLDSCFPPCCMDPLQ